MQTEVTALPTKITTILMYGNIRIVNSIQYLTLFSCSEKQLKYCFQWWIIRICNSKSFILNDNKSFRKKKKKDNTESVNTTVTDRHLILFVLFFFQPTLFQEIIRHTVIITAIIIIIIITGRITIYFSNLSLLLKKI